MNDVFLSEPVEEGNPGLSDDTRSGGSVQLSTAGPVGDPTDPTIGALSGSLWELFPQGAILVDHGGHIQEVNPYAARMFGYRPEELAGRSVDLLAPVRFQHHIDGWLALFDDLDGARRDAGERPGIIGLRKDGSEFPIEIGMTPLDASDGSFVLLTVRDLTERDRMAQALRDKEREVEELVAAASHAYRTPLVSLDWILDELQMGSCTSCHGQTEPLIDRARRHLARAHRVVDGILDYARMQEHEGHDHVVDVSERVDDVIRVLNPMITQRRIRLDVARNTLPHIEDRGRHLDTALMAVLENAVRFASTGGSIRIEGRMDRNDQGEPGGRIIVADDGPGVPDDERERIFGLYQRGTTASGRLGAGSGLGLAFARKAARALDAAVHVEQSELGGAAFVLSFPLERIGAWPVDHPYPEDRQPMATVKTLVQQRRTTA